MATATKGGRVALKSGPAAERKVELLAYAGGVVSGGLEGRRGDRLVVDLAGLRWPAGGVPILWDHQAFRQIGQAKALKVSSGKLFAEGKLTGSLQERRAFELSSDAGVQWQSSIGFNPRKVRELSDGQACTVNGQKVQGPCIVVDESELLEISVVAAGADHNTAAVALSRKARLERIEAMRQKIREASYRELFGGLLAPAAVDDDDDDDEDDDFDDDEELAAAPGRRSTPATAPVSASAPASAPAPVPAPAPAPPRPDPARLAAFGLPEPGQASAKASGDVVSRAEFSSNESHEAYCRALANGQIRLGRQADQASARPSADRSEFNSDESFAAYSRAVANGQVRLGRRAEQPACSTDDDAVLFHNPDDGQLEKLARVQWDGSPALRAEFSSFEARLGWLKYVEQQRRHRAGR